MWKGTLQDQYLSTGQEGYAFAAPVCYPDGVELIDCALGTNPLGTPPSVKAVLETAKELSVCGYPEPEPERLKETIVSKFPSWNVRPEHILVGGGSMGVLVTLSRLLLGPEASFTGVSPQFTDGVLQGMYTGASYHPVLPEAPGFIFGGDIPQRLTASASSLIYLDRPNNPTGQTLSLEMVERISREAMNKNTWLLVDEAYGDFIPDEESAASIDLPNLVTCRSFSKGRGAAGIRVGFALTRNRELAAAFRKLQPPFVVGVLDALLAEAILQDDRFLEETRRYVRSAKEKTIRALQGKKGLTAAETDLRAPILLLTRDSGDLVAMLGASGISCEPGTGFFGLDNSSVRLRVPSPEHLDEFLRRLDAL